MQDFKKEDRVRYVPHHANGDQSHPDCETGIVVLLVVGDVHSASQDCLG